MAKAKYPALDGLARFLLATALAAVGNALIYVVAALFGASGPPSLPVYFALILLQSFVVISAFALLLAVPISIALASASKESLLAYIASGAVAGTLMFELMHILLSSDISLQQHFAPRALLYSVGTAGIPGALFGLFWWQFGRKPLLKRENHG